MNLGTSIGIIVRPEDEARLETVMADMKANRPGMSDDECVDLIFRVGLELAGGIKTSEEPTL